MTLFLAPTGSQGVKMSVRLCDIMLKSPLKESWRGKLASKRAGKHLEGIQSDPCPIGACLDMCD